MKTLMIDLEDATIDEYDGTLYLDNITNETSIYLSVNGDVVDRKTVKIEDNKIIIE